MTASLRAVVISCLLAACSGAPELPTAAPPLADLEEPLELLAEPDDEVQRRALPAGSFSGVVVDDGRDTLAAKLDSSVAVRVVRIVENSPAAAAGLQVDDVLLEAQIGEAAPIVLERPGAKR